MATAAAGEVVSSGAEAGAEAANADTNNSSAEADIVHNTNSANMNVVTPPPCPIPPGLMPPVGTAETALAWRRRSEAALAGAAAPMH